MGLSALRRLATPVVAGAAAVGLLVAGGGPAFAADPPPPSSNQGSSDNVKYKKEVVGSNVLHRGDTVTYKSTIWVDSGVERYIPKFRDVPPAGFTLVAGSPKVTYLSATNKASFSNESDGGVSAKCSGSGCNVFGNGFIVKSGQDVTLEASYKVPDNFAFGTYDSGVLLDVYAFSGNPKGSSPFNVKVRVEEFATTTVLQAPSSATTGQPVTLTATVNPSNASGQVQFKDAGVNIGSPVTPVNGVATLSQTFDSAGAHSVTAEFVPGAGYFGSTSAAQTVSVTDPVVPTSLALSAPPTATTGTSVDLTATVSPSNAQGSVQFKDNGSNIGAPVTVANGSAVLAHSFDSASMHSITAEFTGAAGFTGSTAAAQNIAVTDPDVQTSLSLTAPTTATTGDSVTLSATVSPSSAQGSVQFKVNGTPVGAPVPVSGGSASMPHTFAAADSYAVTAEFTGATGFTDSSAATHNITVSVPDVVTSLEVSAPGAASTGESVELTATVDPSNAAGTVQFSDNGVNIGDPVAVVNGVATLPHTFDVAGSHSIGASFAGAAGFTNATATAHEVSVSVPDVVTSLEVSAPGSATTGESVDLEATVDPSNAAGTVQFSDNGVNIGDPVAVVNGAATLSHSFDAAGSHSIGAAFAGTTGFTDSSAAAKSVEVSVPDVVTSLEVSAPGAATTGESVELSATVNPSDARGTVQFSDNGVNIGDPVAVVNGAATLPHSFDAAGSHSIGASFAGAAGFTNATATAHEVSVSVPVVVTALSLTSPTTASTGESVTLSAAVTPSDAQGAVQFSVNGAPVGAPVAVSAGTASLSHTFDAAGSFDVTAEFTGATGFTNSSASAQSVSVTDPVVPDIETSTVIGIPPTATTGVETTLSVTVKADSGSAVPTGSVQFQENGSPIGDPVVLVNGSGSLVHTFDTVGTQQITAVYTPDAGFTGSVSLQSPIEISAPDPVDVPSSVAMTSTTTATTGTPVTLTAAVTGAPTLPGTVQFFDGGVALGEPVPVVNGVAKLEHTFDQAGPHQIHAVYSGGTGVRGSTSEVQVLDVAKSSDTGSLGSLGSGSLGSLSGLRFGS